MKSFGTVAGAESKSYVFVLHIVLLHLVKRKWV